MQNSDALNDRDHSDLSTTSASPPRCKGPEHELPLVLCVTSSLVESDADVAAATDPKYRERPKCMERGILQLRTSQRWLSSPLYTAARARTIPPFTKHGHGRLLTKKRDLPDVKVY